MRDRVARKPADEPRIAWCARCANAGPTDRQGCIRCRGRCVRCGKHPDESTRRAEIVLTVVTKLAEQPHCSSCWLLVGEDKAS